MHPLLRLIYVSKCGAALEGVALQELAIHSRANNTALGITSVVVHCGKYVLQTLEGNPDTLDALFERIRRDTRHGEIRLLLREDAEQRVFDNIHLGVATLTEERIASLVGATDQGLATVSLCDLNVGRAKRLLAAIARSSPSRTGPYPIGGRRMPPPHTPEMSRHVQSAASAP